MKKTFSAEKGLSINADVILSNIWKGKTPISHGGTGATTTISAQTSLGLTSINSPAFTGNPNAPTPTITDNSSSIATTEYVVSVFSLSYNYTNVYTYTANPGIDNSLYLVPVGRTVPQFMATNDFLFYTNFTWNRIAATPPPTISVGGGLSISDYQITLDTFSGNTNFKILGNIDTGTWSASVIGIGAGGTGANSLAQAKTNLNAASSNSPNFTGLPSTTIVNNSDNSSTISCTSYVHSFVNNNLAPFCTISSPNLIGTPSFDSSASAIATTIATTSLVQNAITTVSPNGIMTFQGMVDASASNPTAAGVGNTPQAGWTYKVSVTGNTAFGFQAKVGDSVIYNGTSWFLLPASAAGYYTDSTLGITQNGNLYTVSRLNNGTPGTYKVKYVDAYGRITGGKNTVTISDLGITNGISIDSPGLSGTPTTPIAASTNYTTQIAATAFVLNNKNNSFPLMNYAGYVGSPLTKLFSLTDHIHPSDTAKADVNSPSISGVPTAPTISVTDNSSAIATTAFVQSLLYNNFKYKGYADASLLTADLATGTNVHNPGDFYIVNKISNPIIDSYWSNVMCLFHFNNNDLGEIPFGNTFVVPTTNHADIHMNGISGYGAGPFTNTTSAYFSGGTSNYIKSWYGFEAYGTYTTSWSLRTTTLSLNGSSWVVEFWVNVTSGGSGYLLYVRDNYYQNNPTETNPIYFGIGVNDGDGNVCLDYQTNAHVPFTSYNRISTNTSVLDGQWHYIALAKSGSSLTLFVDGIKSAFAPTVTMPPSNLLVYTTTSYFYNCAGYLAELRLTGISGTGSASDRGYASATSLMVPVYPWPDAGGPLFPFGFFPSMGSIVAYLNINGTNQWKPVGPNSLPKFNTTSLNLINNNSSWTFDFPITNHGGGTLNKTSIDGYGRVIGYSSATAGNIISTLGFTPWPTSYTPLLKNGGATTGTIKFVEKTQTFVDKTVDSGIINIDLSTGNVFKLQSSGTCTVTFSNWPSTNVGALIFFEIINGGSMVISWPTINFIKNDGSSSTTPNRGLKIGTTFAMFWSRDNGNTIWGKIV